MGKRATIKDAFDIFDIKSAKLAFLPRQHHGKGKLKRTVQKEELKHQSLKPKSPKDELNNMKVEL